MTATLYGISVGPGDPELMTLKAVRLLREVAVVAYPRGPSGTSLAMTIAEPHIPADARRLAFDVPMETSREPAMAAYDAAAAAIGQYLATGKDVACLCEGDAFFYGSFMYLFQRLTPEYPVEIVPGVTSLTATAAVAALPLAARNDILTVIPAPLPAETIRQRLDRCDAAAIIKVGRHFNKIRDLITDLGLADNAVLVEAATRADQKITRLRDTSADQRPYFSTILVYKGAEPWI